MGSLKRTFGSTRKPSSRRSTRCQTVCASAECGRLSMSLGGWR